MFGTGSKRNAVRYILAFVFIVLIYAFIFQYIMITYENKDYDLLTAVYWVFASMTTTGYGDIESGHNIGRVFSSIVAFSGQMIILALLLTGLWKILKSYNIIGQ